MQALEARTTLANDSTIELMTGLFSRLDAIIDIEEFNKLQRQITERFVTENLAITDESTLNAWLDQETHPLDNEHLNRLLWQALTTSPIAWSALFVRLIETVALSSMTLDQDDHYPHDLISQMRWLLHLAKFPQTVIEGIPHLFIPCYLTGFRTKNFTNFGELAQLLVTPCQRGRWPALPDGIQAVKLVLGDCKFDTLLLLVLFYPETELPQLLEIVLDFLTDDEQLADLIDILPESIRLLDPEQLHWAQKCWHLIKRSSTLAKFLLLFPESDRLALVEKGGELICNGFDLANILPVLSKPQRHQCLSIGRKLIQNARQLARVLECFDEIEREEILNQEWHLVQNGFDLAEVVNCLPINVRLKWVDSKCDLIQNTHHLASVLETLPMSERRPLLEKGWHFVKNGHQLERVIRCFEESERLEIADKGMALITKVLGDLSAPASPAPSRKGSPTLSEPKNSPTIDHTAKASPASNDSKIAAVTDMEDSSVRFSPGGS